MAGHPLRPATRQRLGRPLPHQQADRPRAHPPPEKPFHQHTMQQLVASSISHPFRQLSQSEGQITHVLLTRSPLEHPPKEAFPHDLHVLSTPPAFVLSQDQTLHRKPKTFPTKRTRVQTRSTSKQSQNERRFQHTNQFIDKHTVEFSKIRRATTPPDEGWTFGG